jgi:hypothetical protein
LWQQSQIKKDKLYFSFGGVTIDGSKSSGMLKLVKALNKGEVCLIGDFLKGARQKSDLHSLQCLANAIGASTGRVSF